MTIFDRHSGAQSPFCCGIVEISDAVSAPLV